MKTPDWATQICDSFGKVGGPQGPSKYRVIWAPDVTEQIYGETMKSYGHVGDRWIIEVLLPWEKFGYWDYKAFGPKPAHGVYWHSQTIEQTWEGEVTTFNFDRKLKSRYMSLEDFGAESLRLVLTAIEKSKTISAWQMVNHRKALAEKEDAEFHNKFSDVYDDAAGIGLVGGPNGENAISGIPSKKGSSDHRIILLEDLPLEEQRRLRCAPGGMKQI
jgi:hypothetical protein